MPGKASQAPPFAESRGPLLGSCLKIGVLVAPVRGPWTSVRWGWQSLVLPIPLGPMWPGSSRPLAGWELFILG